MIKFILRYLQMDRTWSAGEWLAILFLIYILGMMLTQDVNAETRTRIEATIIQAARENNINPELALAMAEVESQMNPDAVGSMGEIGLFQLRPEYHDVQRGKMRANVYTAMVYLAKLKHECRHYGDAFFVCYNYGPTRPLRYPRLFPYYKKVKAAIHRRRLMNVASND